LDSKKWGSAALVLGAVMMSVLAGEAFARIVDGRYIFGGAQYFGTPSVVPIDGYIAKIDSTLPDVGQLWKKSPPPLEREKTSADLQRLREFGEKSIDVGGSQQVTQAELFKVWNSKYAVDPCNNAVLKHLTRWPLDYFESTSGDDRPLFRYRPNAVVPMGVGMVTNQIGWRGKPIVDRTPETVRIVFVGASTIAEGPYIPFSAPELLEEWLNAWAVDRGLRVRFQVLNAGREGAMTADVVAIVRNEVVALRPDLVIFYEGALRFDWSSTVKEADELKARPRPEFIASAGWVADVAQQSSLFAHILTALNEVGISTGTMGEPDKPKYEIAWPEGLDEKAPDIRRNDLPLNLTPTLKDFDLMRTALDKVGAEFALSSFVWMVYDGLRLDSIKGRYIWETNNRVYWPWTYRDIRRGLDFENRVYREYAKAHGLAFLDVASLIPTEPLLFADGVHMSESGVRVKAWAFFRELLPLIEQHLASGAWPRHTGNDPLPTFEVKRRTVHCN
jgi:hypothetical protein